jgi:CheY-like chemotaxis protein
LAVVSLEGLQISKLILDGYAINLITISFYNGDVMTSAKVFIVEDDEILTKVIEWRLDKLGYTVCGSAATGVEAIALITEKKPDIVLLDIELKGHMDGIDVGEFLSSKSKIPFIYLTSHTEDEILKRAVNTKPKGYIKKPFSDNDLRIAIELAL